MPGKGIEHPDVRVLTIAIPGLVCVLAEGGAAEGDPSLPEGAVVENSGVINR